VTGRSWARSGQLTAQRERIPNMGAGTWVELAWPEAAS